MTAKLRLASTPHHFTLYTYAEMHNVSKTQARRDVAALESAGLVEAQREETRTGIGWQWVFTRMDEDEATE